MSADQFVDLAQLARQAMIEAGAGRRAAGSNSARPAFVLADAVEVVGDLALRGGIEALREIADAESRVVQELHAGIEHAVGIDGELADARGAVVLPPRSSLRVRCDLAVERREVELHALARPSHVAAGESAILLPENGERFVGPVAAEIEPRDEHPTALLEQPVDRAREVAGVLRSDDLIGAERDLLADERSKRARRFERGRRALLRRSSEILCVGNPVDRERDEQAVLAREVGKSVIEEDAVRGDLRRHEDAAGLPHRAQLGERRFDRAAVEQGLTAEVRDGDVLLTLFDREADGRERDLGCHAGVGAMARELVAVATGQIAVASQLEDDFHGALSLHFRVWRIWQAIRAERSRSR